MSDRAVPRPQGGDSVDPWAPPERAQAPVEPGKRVPVHDQPTITSIPTGDVAGGELPPPPVAPGGPAAYGAPTPPPGYGHPPRPAAPGYGHPAPVPGYGYPPAGSATGSYGYPPAGPATGSYGYPPVHPMPYGPMSGQRNGMGTAALVLGIIGTCLFWLWGVPSIVLGVLALIFGILGRKRANRGEANNGGSATAGIVLGSVSLVLGAAVLVLIVLAYRYEEYEEEGTGERTSAILVVDTPRQALPQALEETA
ncbi:DUF4190 domain-containing protein [Streptomyces sp. NPDC127049]|uniref:DUF4190 domain-containing protein n=1 Tax=Streptomyces sp. NPDC127049 TaxID=3347118 RepID=UPI00365C2EA5